MKLSEWKSFAIWFDSLISGWKRFIALILVLSAMYLMDEGYAKHIVSLFGLFIGSAGFAAKKVANR